MYCRTTESDDTKEACNKCPFKNKCRYMEGTTGYNVCDNYNMIYGNHRL